MVFFRRTMSGFFLPLLISGATCCGGSNPDKDYICTSCVTQPDALPGDDDLRTGVYKGVLVDVDEERSLSGVLKAAVKGGETGGNCIVIVDGQQVSSSSFAVYPTPDGDTDQDGEADPDEDAVYEFSGDRFVFELTVTPDGNILDTAVEWDDKPARALILKESSSSIVEAFEGRWKGSTKAFGSEEHVEGVWNFVTSAGEVVGRYDSDIFGGSGDFVGGFEGEYVEVFDADDGDPLATGERTNDYVGGSWEKEASEASGTWFGKRTL